MPANYFAVYVLAGGRAPQNVRLTRTYTNAQLKAPTESNYASITGMCVSPDGGRTLLADCMNGTVKAFELAAGSLSTLYKESEHVYRVSNVCVAAQTEDTQSLFVVESNNADSHSKRLVVADGAGAAGIFTRTYDIEWKDDSDVRVWRGRMCAHILLPAPTRPFPAPLCPPS